MKNLLVVVIAFLVLSLSSCEAIAGIFKAGVGVGIFIVVAVVALIIFIAAKATGK